jgi:hypothetical protein
MAKKYPASSYIPPEPADLSNPADAEVWLDLAAAALQGYCSATWTKNGEAAMVSASISSKNAKEAADYLFQAYKERVRGEAYAEEIPY